MIHSLHRKRDDSHAAFGQRVRIAVYALLVVAGLIIIRLFFLMVIEHDFYTALAASAQEAYSKLIPKRGEIFMSDSRTGDTYPLAINEDVFLLFADTREIKDDSTANRVVDALAQKFSYTPDRKQTILNRLNKRTSAYQLIEQRLDQPTRDNIDAQNLPGLHFIRQPHRLYPEKNLAAQVVGFLGKDDAGNDHGRYGIEGYWDKQLAGKGGFFQGATSASGNWISNSPQAFQQVEDGTDLVLTIDRAIQYKACERLRQGMIDYEAASGSLVIMEPKTGAILAMCSLPDFDPNQYGKVTKAEAFNNSTVFTPYEPGSIFKPIVMSGALNEGVFTPDSPFHDSGRRDGLCDKPIMNAGSKSFGDQNMTGILQNSINTGMVYVAEHLGKAKVTDYIKRYGFGVETGLEIDTEVSGVIDSLSQNKNNKLDCYTATAAFGQGITVTPLQAATAFSAIANAGTLMEPYIIKEKHFSDGHTEVTKPKPVQSVISRRTATQVGAMLVETVDKGYSGHARVPGYYVAGKSGTAEISGMGGYTKTYNHSFIGFAPANDPKFVILVKYEKPNKAYAESTAAYVFGDLSKFLLEYYQVAPTRQ